MYDYQLLHYSSLLLSIFIPLFIRYISDIEALVALTLVLLLIINSIHLITYNVFNFGGYIIVSNFLIALGLVRVRFSHQFWDMIVFGLSIYSIIAVTILGIPSNNISQVGSRNILVTVLLFFAGIGHLQRVSDGVKIEIFSITSNVITVVAILIIGGRTGVGVGVGLLMVYFVYYDRQADIYFMNLYATGFIFIVILAFFILLYSVQLQSIERLLNRGIETPRWPSWRIGIRELETQGWLIGVPPDWWQETAGMLPHNSFLRTLSKFGISGLVAMIAGFLYLLYKYVGIDASLVLLIFVLFFRIIFDSHFIAPYLGILIFLLLLFPNTKFDHLTPVCQT